MARGPNQVGTRAACVRACESIGPCGRLPRCERSNCACHSPNEDLPVRSSQRDGERSVPPPKPRRQPVQSRPIMGDLPGGPLASRPLHFIWILDRSGAMSLEGKIQQLNFAIREAIDPMRETARENPNAEVLVRVLTFSTGAQWHLATPTPVADFRWSDVTAPPGGVTEMGKALTMVAEQLRIPPMTDYALPPVLVLVSDGQPTDEFASGLQTLLREPWGARAVKLAIAVGQDADLDVLTKFMANPEMQPLQANNAATLVQYIRWASTAVLKSASSPASRPPNSVPGGVNVPIPIAPGPVTSQPDVW